MVCFDVIHMLPVQSHYLRFMIIATYEKCFEALETIVSRRYEELARVLNKFGEDLACPPQNDPQKSPQGMLAAANLLWSA